MPELYDNERFPHTGYPVEHDHVCAVCGRAISAERDEEIGICTVCEWRREREGLDWDCEGESGPEGWR